jgi:hypothetical protein
MRWQSYILATDADRGYIFEFAIRVSDIAILTGLTFVAQ